MFNKITKMLLVGTSLAPVLLIMAVNDFFRNGCPSWWCFTTQLILIAIGFVVIAVSVMREAKKGERQSLHICKAKNTDKQVLTFLVAYLLPVLNEHKYFFKEFNVPTLALLFLVAVAVYHSNAFDFNPLLGMLGYHFYEVEESDGFPYLLISPTSIKKPCQEMTVVQLFDYTFLHIEKK